MDTATEGGGTSRKTSAEQANWVKRKAEGPLDKQQHKRLNECIAMAEATLALYKEVPERYYIHEWVLTHQFIVNESYQRGHSRAPKEGVDPQENGHNDAAKPLIPPATPPVLLEEIFLLETKIAELNKTVLHSTQTGHYGRLTSTRRKAHLQLLNNNLFMKFAALWGIKDGSHHKLVRDQEGSGFWYTAFKGRFMVSWNEFMDAWTARFEALNWSSKNTEELRRIIDYSGSGVVSALQFSEFLKGFGPLSSCATNFLDVISQPWFHGYMSFDDAERLLNNEAPGSFLFRLRNTRPGSFAMAVVMPSNAVIQLLINNNHPMGFQVKDDDTKFLTCATIGDIVEMYKNILKKPFTSPINKESWFHGDLTGAETQLLLAGQNRGKFLIRFSKDHPDCFATAYVDNNGEVTHALIKKSPQGYQHGEDRLFPSINQLISAYQGVLSFPWSDDTDTIGDIGREAQELIAFLQEGVETASTDTEIGSDGGGEKVEEGEESVAAEPRRLTKLEKLVGGASLQDRVFGTDLVTYMKQHPKYPVPLVAEQTILYLNQHAKTLGLFALAVGPEEIRVLKETFDKGHNADLWPINNPHIVAALLKVYLRELPNPLLSNALYKDFVSITEMPGDKQVEQLAVVLKKMPPEHMNLLRYLMKLFLKMQDEVDTNLMDAENLAKEMGPNLLRSNSTTLASSVTDTQKAIEITTLLINNAKVLFPDLETLTLDWVVEEDIVLTPNRNKIKSATKDCLVQTLFYSSCLNPGAVPTFAPKFLLTYRAFMTPVELLDMIQKTFLELQSDPDSPKRAEKMLRICSFLKKWTEEQPYAFDEMLLKQLTTFVSSITDTNQLRFMMGSLSRLDSLNKGMKKTKTRVFRTPAPKSLLPKVKGTITKLSDIKTLELARQITLLEYKMFSKIQPQELCEAAWTKKDKETAAPNVLRLARRFNDMVWWMVTQVVSCEKQSKREDVVQKFIELALHCKELNNFNCVMEVVAAFNTAPLARLVDVKKKLELSAVFQEVKDMMAHDNNYRNYRARISQCNPPLVPYVGCFQTDLVFIEDGNKLYVGDQIHFYKCYMVAEIIQQMRQYQQTPYNLTPVRSIKDFIRNIKPLSEDDCWDRSIAIQPPRKN